MKMFKKLNLLVVTAVVCVFIGFITGCNLTDDTEEEEDLPKDHSEVITGLFDNNSSATVKGYLIDAEWAGVPDIIKNELNFQFANVSNSAKTDFRSLFANGITYIIEKDLEEADSYYCKVNKNTYTIYFDYIIIHDETKLRQTIGTSEGYLLL